MLNKVAVWLPAFPFSQTHTLISLYWYSLYNLFSCLKLRNVPHVAWSAGRKKKSWSEWKLNKNANF